MISADDIKLAGRSIWRHRGRRLAIGLNVLASILLAGLIVVMVNFLSYRHYTRWDLSRSDYYRLSDKTISLLSSLDAEVNILVFFQKSHGLYDDVRRVLKEYEYEAVNARKLRLNIEFVDPDRDLARMRQLKQKYDLKDTNVIVFESANRRKYVEIKKVVDYDYSLEGRQIIKKTAGFKAEQLFSSAIQSVTQSTWPIVYFLAGHGERDLDDIRPSGYSDMARLMRRDNMEIRPLFLAERRSIPKDCSVIVVAGPDHKLSAAEVDILSAYLERNGRALFLIDPSDPSAATGLEKLLENWGVRLCPEEAVGTTLTGRELIVSEYGTHPVTRSLKKIVTMFYMPRVVEPITAPSGPPDTLADKPKVSVLAANTAEGWAESNLKESPPRFDPHVDRPGPVSIALAVEKGRVGGIEVGIKPTRLVVIGDSYFVSNGALSSGVGGNVDFFMSSLNWLVERESLMGIAPRVPGILRLDMNQTQTKVAFLAIVVLPATAVMLIGLAVWLKRRR